MKSNNPFKMWGSWIGVSIIIISILFNQFLPPFICKLEMASGSVGEVIGNRSATCLFGLSNEIWMFIVIISGFLLGWGIHSIFRRMR